VSKNNVFSLDRFRTKGWSEQTVEVAKPEVKKAAPGRRPLAEMTFVRLPYQQITQLYGRLSVAAFHVMVELDHQHFKNRGKNPLKLTNQTDLAAAGMRRNTKVKAARAT
jgi:hypothetical protein